jgi:hypothetical protein
MYGCNAQANLTHPTDAKIRIGVCTVSGPGYPRVQDIIVKLADIVKLAV